MRLFLAALVLIPGLLKAQFTFVPDSIEYHFEEKLSFGGDAYSNAQLFRQFEKNEGIPTDSLYYAWYLLQKGKATTDAEDGLELRQEAYGIFSRHANVQDKAFSEYNMAYHFLGEDDNLSAYHLKKSKQFAVQVSDTYLQLEFEYYSVFQAIFDAYWSGNLDDSLVDASSAVALNFLAKGDSLGFYSMHLYLNLVRIHIEPESIDAPILKEAMHFAKGKGLSAMYTYAMNIYAESFVEVEDFPKRDSLLKEVLLHYQSSSDSLFYLQYPYFALADLYYKWGLYEEAYNYQARGVQYKSKAYLEKVEIEKAEIQSLYNFRAVEKEKIMAEKARQDTIIFYSVVLGLVLIIAAVGFAFSRANQKKKDLIISEQKSRINSLVNAQDSAIVNSLIEGRERERTYIARELHDRVGSLLSAIRLRLESAESDHSESKQLKKLFGDTSGIMQEAIQEVRSISRNIGTNVVADIGIENAVRNLVHALNQTKLIQINLEVHLGNIKIPDNYALTLYRVLQELFTNSLRHSKAKKIDVDFVQREKELSLVFEDNGVGFNPQTVKKGIGLQSIEARINEVHGELKIESAPGQGAIFIVEIPLPQLDLV